jgi:hypothetical protein
MVKKILSIVSFLLVFAGCAGEVNTPKLVMLGSAEVTIEVGQKYIDAGCTAEDREDGNLTKNIVVSGLDKVDTTKIGTYTITYMVEDSNGHEEYVTRTVKVIAKAS